MCPALRARLGPKLALARAYDGGCASGWCDARKGLRKGERGGRGGGEGRGGGRWLTWAT